VEKETKNPHQKALAINLARSRYGTIAEIGAGQETARWFFRAGGAAGTVAKTMSAYDMKYSDAIYGPAPRYVSRERLIAMLEHEYDLLLQRLDTERGSETTFFAFANTVAARSYTRKSDGQGWLGIRFQDKPRSAPSDIHLHVNLHGKNNVQDQETLGILGVNLIYGAMAFHSDHEKLLLSLMDELHRGDVEVDLVDFSGPAFAGVDNRLVALRLVQKGLASASLFSADGKVAQIADTLWNKAVIVERSRFRPPTHLTIDLLDSTQRRFCDETGINSDQLIVLSEMTLRNLTSSEADEIDVQDFLYRADILCALGKHVLISNYGEYYRLAQYLFRYTKMPIAIAMGLPSLKEIFDEKYYQDLPGGILESFGRMFKHDLRLYVCPEVDPASGSLVGVGEFSVAPHLGHLFAYLVENRLVRALDSVDTNHLNIYSHEVLEMIRRDSAGWEAMVPDQVAQMIKENKLFGWRENV
jgi:hypothetical protein